MAESYAVSAFLESMDIPENGHPSIYKSEQGRKAIMRWYDRQLDGLSVPVTSRIIDTSFGRTHVLASGPAEAPPLIVLHGMNMNAAAMGEAITRLSAIRRLYAVDIIGMPGKSAGTRPSRRGNGYAGWLREVMEALGVAQADFLGQSFGGWLILKLAAIWPGSVRSAALLDSGGFVSFTLWGQMVAGTAALRHMLRPSKQSQTRAVQPFYGPGMPPDPCFAELLGLTFQHTRMDIDLRGLPTLSREKLAGFHAPVFVSYGEHDVFFNAQRAVRKAKEMLSGPVIAEIVEGEGHKFSEAASRARYGRVRSFLDNTPA